jgi:hypothetical protein
MSSSKRPRALPTYATRPCSLLLLAAATAGCFDPENALVLQPHGTGTGSSSGELPGPDADTDAGSATTTDDPEMTTTGGVPSDVQCGDGIVEGDELCDLANLDGRLCEALGYGGGTLACADDCTFDVSQCNACGNGVLDGDEVCDGTEFQADDTCDDVGLGLPSESLHCTPWCMLDFAECSACGDGTVTRPEVCEPGLLGGATCASQGYDGGTLACARGCTFDFGGCAMCGNGSLEGDEVCDGNELAAGCEDLGFGGGILQCAADCTYDTSACEMCGDGSAGGTEACDGADLSGATCQSQGFFGGALSCAADCTFDVGACMGEGCGNGVVEGVEQCDGSAAGHTCLGETGLPEGEVTCTPACMLDTSDCSGTTARRVFVTSGSFPADFGGAVGGDALCQAVADDAGLAGTFLAWLSDGSTTPLVRFTHSDGPYELIDGTHVADDWADLVDGSIAAAIGRDEVGALVPVPPTIVVTATTAGGVLQPFNGACQDWTTTSAAFSAGVGNPQNTITWSDSGATNCASQVSLYCFEQ